MSKWVIGKYIRLSQADKDLSVNDNKTESGSVSHQKAMIQNFIDADPALKDCEQYEFFDDGYSGTNFARPSFEKLMDKIKRREINCVIVKDFSRFGRDYIELGDYLERIFPFLGVRFISINDHYDSLDYKGTTGGLDVVMKNIVYAYYSKDLSVKVSTAKRAKMKRGEYIGGQVPYGLMKDPDDKHKLMIDEEPAKVVREIFDAALGGMKIVDIVRELNEKGYETPGQYFRRKHPDKKKFRNVSKMNCWSTYNVRSILQQEMYYGAVVGHKRKNLGVGSKHTTAVPKEKQVIVEGMHPGIVTKEEFLEVQKIFHKRGETKRVVEKTYPLWKKVKCGTCGRSMRRKSKIINGVDYRYFYCPYAQEQVGEGGCTKRFTPEDELNEAVWKSVKAMIAAAGGVREKIKSIRTSAERDNADMVKRLAELQRDRKKCDSDRFSNVDQFMAGNLDKDVYQSRRKELTEMAGSLDKQIGELEEKLRAAETAGDDETQKALEMLDGFSGVTELTQDMVRALIDKVMVYDPEHVEIRWKFGDEVKKLLEG